MPVLDRPVDVAGFWRDGWTVVKNVYSLEEIEAFREACRQGGGGKGGDLLARPLLRSVLTDGALIGIAKKILNSDQIWYGGDSSFTINAPGRGWHKDNADRTDGNAPDWKSDYTQLRFGIYLQDHTEHTGGLNLRTGSHNLLPLSEGENVYVKSGVGDVGVWSMRITHSGNGELLKDGSTTDPNDDVKGRVDPSKLTPRDGDRMAVFAALGLDDEHAARYTEYLKTRKYMADVWRWGQYDDAARQAAKDAGLILRDVPAEILADPTAGRNTEWAPLPY